MTKPYTQALKERSRLRQRGGTFLGMVIGLVIGLGVALAVAVYVTKVPVPFVNKGQSRSVEQDAAEAKKNKDWDPNAMIQGKNPVRSSSGSVASGESAAAKTDAKTDARTETKPEAKSEAKADPKADAKSESKADAKSEAKPTEAKSAEVKPEAKTEAKKPTSADPLGDLVKAKSANAPVDPFTYMVQTGAFRVPDDAEAQRAKLTMLGVDVKVSEREQSGRTVYRVRTGPFERKEDAEKAKEKLESSGFETVLVRIQR
jgi:cell division protein FtsN